MTNQDGLDREKLWDSTISLYLCVLWIFCSQIKACLPATMWQIRWDESVTVHIKHYTINI